MADTLIRELREVAAIMPDVRVQRVMREAAKELEARRSTSSASEGEMSEAVSDFRKAAYEFGKHHEPDDHARMMEAQLRIFTTFRAATKAAAPADALSEFASKLTLNQVPLDADMARVYRENAWNMYADDSRAPAEDAREEVQDSDMLVAYREWLAKRGPLGVGAMPERIFFAGYLAARRASSVPAIPGTATIPKPNELE